MLKSHDSAVRAEKSHINTPDTETILVSTAAALVVFLMIYLAFFDRVLPI